MKVTVSNVLTKNDIKELAQHSKNMLKEYVISQNKKNAAFKFYPASILIERKKTTNAFLQYRHICMNCGDVQEMVGYAIAQIAMGHKVNYTCDCGHTTILPQIR